MLLVTKQSSIQLTTLPCKWDGQTNDNDNAHCSCFCILCINLSYIFPQPPPPSFQIHSPPDLFFYGCYCCVVAIFYSCHHISHCCCYRSSYGSVELFVCVPAALNYLARWGGVLLWSLLMESSCLLLMFLATIIKAPELSKFLTFICIGVLRQRTQNNLLVRPEKNGRWLFNLKEEPI